MFKGKYLKIHKFCSSNRKRSCKNGKEITKNLSHMIQFIDSARYMASSLSNLVNNLSKGIDRIKCKFGHDNKQCETFGIKLSTATVFLNIQTLKMI